MENELDEEDIRLYCLRIEEVVWGKGDTLLQVFWLVFVECGLSFWEIFYNNFEFRKLFSEIECVMASRTAKLFCRISLLPL